MARLFTFSEELDLCFTAQDFDFKIINCHNTLGYKDRLGKLETPYFPTVWSLTYTKNKTFLQTMSAFLYLLFIKSLEERSYSVQEFEQLFNNHYFQVARAGLFVRTAYFDPFAKDAFVKTWLVFKNFLDRFYAAAKNYETLIPCVEAVWSDGIYNYKSVVPMLSSIKEVGGLYDVHLAFNFQGDVEEVKNLPSVLRTLGYLLSFPDVRINRVFTHNFSDNKKQLLFHALSFVPSEDYIALCKEYSTVSSYTSTRFHHTPKVYKCFSCVYKKSCGDNKYKKLLPLKAT